MAISRQNSVNLHRVCKRFEKTHVHRFDASKQTKIPKIMLSCVLVFKTNQKSQTKTSLICVYCNHATHFHFHVCLFIFSHPFIFFFSFSLIFSSSFSSSFIVIFMSHSFPTFPFCSCVLSSPLSSSFLHSLPFSFPYFCFPLPFFHLSPIPHSCKNQSHWRFCGDFCDYSDCDLLYFYCVCIVFYCIPIIKFASGF